MDVKTVSRHPMTHSRRRFGVVILAVVVAILAGMLPETAALAQAADSAQAVAAHVPATGDINLGFSDILWPLLLALGGFLYLTSNRTV